MPGQQIWPSLGPGPSNCSKNSASLICILRVKTLSAQDRHTRNLTWRNFLESKAFSASYWNWTQVTWLTATRLNHWAIRLFGSFKKNDVWLVVFRNLEPPFLHAGSWLLFLDSLAWISRPDTTYQSSWTQTFDQYMYHVRQILELKYHSLMLIEQLIGLEKVSTDNLKFRTELQDQVMDGWSVTQ